MTALGALHQILFVDVSHPASLFDTSLSHDMLSLSDAYSWASIGAPGVGGPRRTSDDHHARTLERRRLLPPCCLERPCNFRVSMLPHLLSVRAPPHLPRMAVCVTGWPKSGTSCIPSDAGDCMRLVIAICPAYGGQTCPDCPSVPGFSFPCSRLVVHQPRISCSELTRIECRHSGGPVLPITRRGSMWSFSSEKHDMHCDI